MDFVDLRTAALLLQQLHGGEEEVVQLPPFAGVEVVEEFHQPGIVEALRAEPLAHVCPVLLFDMGVVILVIGPRARDLHGALAVLEVVDQMPVQELAAIITIEAPQQEGQSRLDGDELSQDVGLAFAPDRALLRPAGGEIGRVDGVDELAAHRGAAVRDRIGFQEAGPRLISLVGADRNLVAQQAPRLRGRLPPDHPLALRP